MTRSEFASQIPVRLANIDGSLVGFGQVLLSMVGKSTTTGSFEARLTGFADGRAPPLVLVVWVT